MRGSAVHATAVAYHTTQNTLTQYTRRHSYTFRHTQIHVPIYTPLVHTHEHTLIDWWCSHIINSSFSSSLSRGHKTRYKKASRWKKTNKTIRAPQYQYAKGTVLQRAVVYYNELWYTIPYHLQRDNTSNIAVVHTYTGKRDYIILSCTNTHSHKHGRIHRHWRTPPRTKPQNSTYTYYHKTLHTRQVLSARQGPLSP